MSLRALAKGSVQPALAGGVLRLYGMRFCPYAYRVRLILAAKKIQYEIVNVNLRDKPEWLFKLNRDGKVPVLEKDGLVLSESVVISDYLEEVYPIPRLTPIDPYVKAKGRLLVGYQGKIMTGALRLTKTRDKCCFDDVLKELDFYDNELKKLGTKFFSGENIGLTDYILWPNFEIILHLKDIAVLELDLSLDQKTPNLATWIAAMKSDLIVKECAPDPINLVAFYKAINDSTLPDYDVGL